MTTDPLTLWLREIRELSIAAIEHEGRCSAYCERSRLAFDPSMVTLLLDIVEKSQMVCTAVERVGLGQEGAIGALYLSGNSLRLALDALRAHVGGGEKSS